MGSDRLRSWGVLSCRWRADGGSQWSSSAPLLSDAVNCARVWDPRAIRAREMLEEGMIGKVRCLVGFCRGGLSPGGDEEG